MKPEQNNPYIRDDNSKGIPLFLMKISVGLGDGLKPKRWQAK